MKYNFLIIPYRDQYFLDKYGYIVRDLMMIRALVDMEEVEKIVVVNRPVSIYERLTNKRTKLPKSDFGGKLEFIDTTSYDIIGPLKKRKWTKTCYLNVLDSIVNIFPTDDNSVTNILLDFTPLANIDYEKFKKDFFIWYDLIDNFTKHNRYDGKEKDMVKKKYTYVNIESSLVTGVTTKAIEQFDIVKKIELNNGILNVEANTKSTDTKYTFGFLGFITDKIDINFLLNLADRTNEKIALYGDVYDKAISNKLESRKNIFLLGKFHSTEVAEIMNSFEIGLIPYSPQLSHDGSPLKLYQYISYAKPVITIEPYEEPLSKTKYVLNVTGKDIDEIISFLKMIRNEKKTNLNFNTDITSYINVEYLWKSKLQNIIRTIEENINK